MKREKMSIPPSWVGNNFRVGHEALGLVLFSVDSSALSWGHYLCSRGAPRTLIGRKFTSYPLGTL